MLKKTGPYRPDVIKDRSYTYTHACTRTHVYLHSHSYNTTHTTNTPHTATATFYFSAKDPERPVETATNRVFVNLGAADEEDSDDAMEDDTNDSKY